MLKELTSKSKTRPMAVALTIHQPSYRVLSVFDSLYVLSGQGKCIYDDHPDNLVQTLSAIKLHCPDNYNPAEFIIDVATGEHGPDALAELSAGQEADFNARTFDQIPFSEKTLEKATESIQHKFGPHFMQIMIR